MVDILLKIFFKELVETLTIFSVIFLEDQVVWIQSLNQYLGVEDLVDLEALDKKKEQICLYETSITLEDVLNGKKIEIDVQKDVECDSCRGSGCASGTSKNNMFFM